MKHMLRAWLNLFHNVVEEATLPMHVLNLCLIPVFPVVYLAVLILAPSKIQR